jgi:hypothetical protein
MHSPQAVYREYHRKIPMRLPIWKKYAGSDIYHITLEKVIQDAGINTRGTIFQRSHQIIGYADDRDIISRSQRELETVFQGLEGNARQLSLQMNENKTKCW